MASTARARVIHAVGVAVLPVLTLTLALPSAVARQIRQVMAEHLCREVLVLDLVHVDLIAGQPHREHRQVLGVVELKHGLRPRVGHIRQYATTLLWAGHLTIGANSWFDSRPMLHYYHVAKASEGTPLARLFDMAARYGCTGARQLNEEMPNLAKLGRSLTIMAFRGPATPDIYGYWERHHPVCLPLALEMLEDTPSLITASNEFLWRVHDHCVAMGADPEGEPKNAKEVVEFFVRRAEALGCPEALLAECIINRCAIPERRVSLATGSSQVLDILADFGRDSPAGASTAETDDPNEIGFTIFQALLGDYCPRLETPHTDRIAHLLEARKEELDATKRQCLLAAAGLLAEKPSGENLSRALLDCLRKLEKEVTAVTESDAAAFRQVVEKLSQNEKLWVALATFVAGLLESWPSIVPQAAAVTAFALLGATALETRRAQNKSVQSSPWAFIYHLRRAR